MAPVSTMSSGDRKMAVVAIAMALGVLWTAPLGCLAQTNSYTGPADYAKYSTQHQYTFPTKSVNLTHASSPSFYHLFGPEVNSESNRETRLTAATCGDHHPVHGTQASDGTYLITGKCITNPESESAASEAFAIKVTAEGALSWYWQSSLSGPNAANAVVQLSATEALVVGWSTHTGAGSSKTGVRTLWKLNLATGAETWRSEIGYDAANPGHHGAYEAVEVSASNQAVYCAGFKQASMSSLAAEMTFKSYGNVGSGKAVVDSFHLTNAMGSSAAPTDSSVSWSADLGPYAAAKAVKATGKQGKEVAVLLYGEAEGKPEQSAGLAVLTAAGANANPGLWPKGYGNVHGEGTDMALGNDPNYVVVTGHNNTEEGTLYGTLTKISIDDGSVAWSKAFSAGGNKKLIYNECWGVASMGTGHGGGYALACGTGIEGCGHAPASMLADCNAGKGDTRAGAIDRPPAVWQSLLIRADESGDLIYQRVDQFRSSENVGLAMTDALFKENGISSSAAEFAVKTSDGGILLVNDEASGVGVFKLMPEQDSSTPTPTPVPEPAPVPAPEPSPAPEQQVVGRARYLVGYLTNCDFNATHGSTGQELGSGRTDSFGYFNFQISKGISGPGIHVNIELGGNQECWGTVLGTDSLGLGWLRLRSRIPLCDGIDHYLTKYSIRGFGSLAEVLVSPLSTLATFWDDKSSDTNVLDLEPTLEAFFGFDHKATRFDFQQQVAVSLAADEAGAEGAREALRRTSEIVSIVEIISQFLLGRSSDKSKTGATAAVSEVYQTIATSGKNQPNGVVFQRQASLAERKLELRRIAAAALSSQIEKENPPSVRRLQQTSQDTEQLDALSEVLGGVVEEIAAVASNSTLKSGAQLSEALAKVAKAVESFTAPLAEGMGSGFVTSTSFTRRNTQAEIKARASAVVLPAAFKESIIRADREASVRRNPDPSPDGGEKEDAKEDDKFPRRMVLWMASSATILIAAGVYAMRKRAMARRQEQVLVSPNAVNAVYA